MARLLDVATMLGERRLFSANSGSGAAHFASPSGTSGADALLISTLSSRSLQDFRQIRFLLLVLFCASPGAAAAANLQSSELARLGSKRSSSASEMSWVFAVPASR